MDTFMEAALEEAIKGREEGGVPIGSVLAEAGKIIGRGHNLRVQRGNPILHGEMACLQDANRLRASVYRYSVLYTTLSPCIMCSGAILLFRIPKVVIGENRTFLGAEELLRSHGVELEVRNDPRCVKLMEEFIAKNPELWNEDIGE
jgi:creatinine deaminase